MCSTATAALAEPDSVPDELIVAPAKARLRAAAAALASAGAVTRAEIPQLGLRVVRVPKGEGERSAAALQESGLFRFVERNFVARIAAVPDDPLFPAQWGLHAVGASAAWATSRGAGVTIAIVDTGVDSRHPDLAPRVLSGFDFLAGTIQAIDDHGHGTRMAGIAAATGFNGLGVIGVAPESLLLPVKSLSATGYGSYADIARGIVYAADQGARVINLSLGGGVPSTTLSEAVSYATARGAVVVAASGNGGSSAAMYPAADPEALAVGASGAGDMWASFSNFGSWLDLVAPGVGIATTEGGGGYGESTGTSPATPFVSGAAALLLSVHPGLRPQQVRAILTTTSADRGEPGADPFYGWGRLDIARAVEQARLLRDFPDSGAPAVALIAPEPGHQVSGEVPLAVEAWDDVGVVRVDYFVDGVPVASAADPPFSAAWDARFAAPGAHVLAAVAYDALGNRGESPLTPVSVEGAEFRCHLSGGLCLPGGRSDQDCLAEWFVAAGAAQHPPRGAPEVRCTDGSGCDFDRAADGTCTFRVSLCFLVEGSALSADCAAAEAVRFRLGSPGARGQRDFVNARNAKALVAAVAALGSLDARGTCVAGLTGARCRKDADCDSGMGLSDGVCGLVEASLAGVLGRERCTSLQDVAVPLWQGRRGLRTGRKHFRAITWGRLPDRPHARRDQDSLVLVCDPPAPN